MRLCALLLCLAASSFGASFYVATNGTAGADGSMVTPWNLVTALTNPPSVHAGDTVWVRAGTYKGAWQSQLTGTSGNVVTLRGYTSERATLDGNGDNDTIQVLGAYSCLRDLEIMNSAPNRTNGTGQGVWVRAQGVKVINCVIHDNSSGGILSGADGTNTESAGCIIYNNGYQAITPDHGHGHGFYLQGSNPLYKDTYGNISFNNFGIGAKAYAETPNIDGFKFYGNTFFGGGSISTNDSGAVGFDYNFQIGGLSMTHNVSAVSNYTYHGPILPSGAMVNGDDWWFLYGTETNGDLFVTNNFAAGGGAAYMYWSNAFVMSNTYVLGGNFQVKNGLSGNEPYVMDYNTYFFPVARATPFYFWSTNAWNFTNWKANTPYDAHSTSTDAMPTGTNVFIVQDRYTPYRANITIFNWASNDNVSVSVSGILAPGTSYQVKNAADWFASPVKSGTYDGNPISIPMTNLTAAAPIGTTNRAAQTWPQFNAFVLLGNAPAIQPPTATIGTATFY